MNIAILILNYYSFQKTLKLIQALQNQSIDSILHIVVVDNSSPNDSYNVLKKSENKYQNLTVLKTSENIGYARGNNYGLKYIEQNLNVTYVAIMNNDIKISNDCIHHLLNKYKILHNPAIIAPKMIYENAKNNYNYKLNSFFDDCISLFVSLEKFSLFLSSNNEIDNTGFDAMKVDLIPGSFMFTNLNTFSKLGYFSPVTFLYNEEMFVANSVKKLGLTNYVLLDYSYIHEHSSPTISKFNDLANKYRHLYNGIVEYTKLNRDKSKIKLFLLRILYPFIFFEKYLIIKIKKFRNV